MITLDFKVPNYVKAYYEKIMTPEWRHVNHPNDISVFIGALLTRKSNYVGRDKKADPIPENQKLSFFIPKHSFLYAEDKVRLWIRHEVTISSMLKSNFDKNLVTFVDYLRSTKSITIIESVFTFCEVHEIDLVKNDIDNLCRVYATESKRQQANVKIIDDHALARQLIKKLYKEGKGLDYFADLINKTKP